MTDTPHGFHAVMRRGLEALAGNGASKLMLLAVEFWLAAHIGAAGYGLFALSLALTVVASSLVILGVDLSLVQFLPICQEENAVRRRAALLRAGLLIALVTGSVSAVALAVSADWIAGSLMRKPELAPLLTITAIALPAEALCRALSGAFRGLREIRRHVIVADLGRNAAMLIALPVGIVAGWDVKPFLAFAAGGAWVAAATGVFMLTPAMRVQTSWKETSVAGKELLAFAKLLLAWNVFQKLAGKTQLVIAGLFLTASQLGVFAVLLRLPALLVVFQSAANQVLPTEFARISHTRDHVALQKILRRSSAVLLVVALTITIPVAVQPARTLALFGQEYVPFAILLTPLLLVQLINVGTGGTGHVLVSVNRQSALLMASLIAAIVQVALSFALMPSLALTGAVIAEAATVLTLTGTKHVLLYRAIGIHVFDRTFGEVLGLGVIGIIVAWAVTAATPTALVQVAASILIALAFLFIALRRTGLPLRYRKAGISVQAA